MLIEKLMIYGYGKFENQSIDFKDQSFQMIYGQNEAGKSTIMSFIHSIFFGFPTKQQTENRYEPKKSNAYGGYIVVRTDDNQSIKIERTSGKASGDLIIENEDGTRLDEAYLQAILGGIDRETYRSIFSFDIHGLQRIQKMNSDQIGKYLFLSSIYGADALFTIENTLTKQQDILYKPTGKRPILNEALTTLKDSHGRLLEAKRNNHDYQMLIDKKNDLKRKLEATALEKKQALASQRELERIHAVLPLLRELNWCEEQLLRLPDTKEFPEDGLQQLDYYNVTLQPLEAELHVLHNKKEQLINEENGIVVNQAVLDLYPSITSLREQLPVYKEKKKKRDQLIERIDQTGHEIHMYKQRIYPNVSDEDLLTIKATVLMKESIKNAIIAEQQLKQRKKTLDEQFEQTKNLLEETEWKISELKKSILSDYERQKLEHEISKRQSTNRDYLKEEQKQLTNQLNIRIKEQQKEKKQRLTIISLFACLVAAGTGWAMFSQYWLVSIVLIIGFFISLFIIKQVTMKKDAFAEHLKRQIKSIEEELAKFTEADSGQTSMSRLLLEMEKDNQTKQALHHEQLLFKQYERNYDRVIGLFEEWEKEQFHHEETYKQLAKELLIDRTAAPEIILEAFELLQQLQELLLKRNKDLSEVQILNEEINQYERRIIEMLESCQLSYLSIEEAAIEIHKLLLQQNEKVKMLTNLHERKHELEESIRSLEDKISYLKAEKESLLKKAGLEDEEQFRRYAHHHSEREELIKQKVWIEKQLATEQNVNLEQLSIKEYDDIDEQLLEIEQEVEKLTKFEKDLHQQYSTVDVKINHIEQNGVYSNLLHSFEMEKAEVRELAEQWVVRALAKDLLHQTVERYRQTKLPALIGHIEQFFRTLTMEQYHRVFLPNQKQSFIVERNDGMRFFAEELSQATAEQLYLSIRLALVKTINEQVTLPIMIDDSFVHFDHERTAESIKLMQELKQENQVIFFTCHKHIAENYQSDTVIHLNELAGTSKLYHP